MIQWIGRLSVWGLRGADTDETGGVISVIRPPVFFLSSPRCRTGAIVIIGYVCIAVDHGQVSATKFINFAGPIAGFMAINREQEPFLKCGIVVERHDKWPYNRVCLNDKFLLKKRKEKQNERINKFHF